MTIEITRPEVEAALRTSEAQHAAGAEGIDAMQASPASTSSLTEPDPLQRPIWTSSRIE